MRTERKKIMTNMPGTPNNSAPKADPLPADTAARPVQAEVMDRPTMPRGLGGYSGSEQQRFRDIFGDDAATGADFGYRGASGFGSASDQYWRPFSSSFAQGPYEDTILFIQHNKRGVRFSLQANTRTFIIIVLIFIALINSPGIGELIGTVVKTILNIH
jgi:hypothetical protein